jgi:hypothetical protein
MDHGAVVGDEDDANRLPRSGLLSELSGAFVQPPHFGGVEFVWFRNFEGRGPWCQSSLSLSNEFWMIINNKMNHNYPKQCKQSYFWMIIRQIFVFHKWQSPSTRQSDFAISRLSMNLQNPDEPELRARGDLPVVREKWLAHASH